MFRGAANLSHSQFLNAFEIVSEVGSNAAHVGAAPSLSFAPHWRSLPASAERQRGASDSVLR